MTPSDTKAFRFKQFSIHHHPDVMKVSTDSVILGSWMNVQHDATILDVGCGNGILSLMAAQKNPNAKIWGIDIQPKAVELASSNFSQSDFTNQTQFLEVDVLNWHPGMKFEHIICNPPYYVNVTPSKDTHRSKTRHTKESFLRELLIWADQYLQPDGKLSIILPENRLDQFYKCLDALGFVIKRELEIFHNKGKPMSLKAMEVRKEDTHLTLNDPESHTLILFDENNKTNKFRELCSAFYL